VPRSLVWATDLDVLPLDHVVERRDGFVVVRSPSNPRHFWGNLLLFDDPPDAGAAARWEQLFDGEFADEPLVHHRTFAWDRVDGAVGDGLAEFADRGYELEETVGLLATPQQIRAHPRESRAVEVRALEPADGVDEELWQQVLELQVADRGERHEEAPYRVFGRARLADLRALFRAGRGAWYVALDGNLVVGSCGVVVTGKRGRFQTVGTAAAQRRRGICSRLVVEAAHHAAEHHGARKLVIAADPDYHALGLYESLGFRRAERVCGVCRQP